MIVILDPVKGCFERNVGDYLSKYYPADKFKVVSLKEGPETVESFSQKTWGCAEILKNLKELIPKTARAVVINCFADPCLFELREKLDIPVFGAGETTMHIAAMLGDFSVVGPGDNVISWTRMQAREYGLFEKLISVRKVKFSVKEIMSGDKKLYNVTREACTRAIEDGADVVVLGCTGFSSIAERLKKDVWKEYQVPVLEPLLITYSAARSLSFVLRHGKGGLFAGR